MSGTETLERPASPRRPKHCDRPAGQLIKDLRQGRYIAREDLPREMLRAGVRRDYVPSVKTVYNVEELGQIPREYLKFGLAQFFGVPVAQVWPAR